MIRRIGTAYKISFSGLSKETWLLSMVIFINRCGYMAVPFMSLYVTQQLHRPPSDAGLIITFFGLGAIMGAALGGYFTDKVGYRPVQIVTSVISGGLFLLFAAITEFSTLCVLAVVIPLFTEAFRPANFAAIAAYAFPGTHTRSYSLNRLATNLGWAVGTSIGGILASMDYRLLFIVDGGVSIIAGGCILFMLPAAKIIVDKKKKEAKMQAARKPWQDPGFLQFMVITTIFAACFFLLFRVGPLFFKEEWKMDESLIGMILGFNGLFIALVEMIIISSMERKNQPLRFVVIGVALTGLSYLFFLAPLGISLLMAFLSMIVFSAGEMMALPFINAFVVSRSTEFNRGHYAAGYTLCWSVAQVIGPAGGFYIAEAWGYNTLWITLFGLLILCAVAYHLLDKRERAAAHHQAAASLAK